jgi:hypothetical protein
MFVSCGSLHPRHVGVASWSDDMRIEMDSTGGSVGCVEWALERASVRAGWSATGASYPGKRVSSGLGTVVEVWALGWRLVVSCA